MTRPRVNSLAAWRALHLSGQPPKLSIDPEMRAYVDELLKTSTFKQTADACRAKFGAERAPSKSAVHRYWLALCRESATRPAEPRKAPAKRAKSRRLGRVRASGRSPPPGPRSRVLRGT